jgi:hypothetical protein
MLNQEQLEESGIGTSEFPAGDDQVIVLYDIPDQSVEIVPAEFFPMIAADAARRARDGWRIVSTSSIPLRHGGVVFGQNGSGFQTKMSIAVVYELRRS